MVKKQAVNYRRYTLSYWKENPSEQKAIVQEQLSKLSQGRDAWNRWMQELTKTTLIKKHGKQVFF